MPKFAEFQCPDWIHLEGHIWAKPIDSANAKSLSEKKKRTQPPPKENILENFSGLKEKLSRPVVDTKNLEKPGNHVHHRNLSSVDPIFSAKKSSALEQVGVWFLFPSL